MSWLYRLHLSWLYSLHSLHLSWLYSLHYDQNLNFFSSPACARYQPGNSTMFITPSSKNLQYKPGEDIILNCTFIFEVQFGARPYWYTERNGHVVFCSSPDYEQTSTYDYHSCKWTTILRIMNFSKAMAGRYICGYATHSQEVTLNVEGKSTNCMTLFSSRMYCAGGHHEFITT